LPVAPVFRYTLVPFAQGIAGRELTDVKAAALVAAIVPVPAAAIDPPVLTVIDPPELTVTFVVTGKPVPVPPLALLSFGASAESCTEMLIAFAVHVLGVFVEQLIAVV
jgi:hypothetical protein